MVMWWGGQFLFLAENIFQVSHSKVLQVILDTLEKFVKIGLVIHEGL